MRKSLLVAVPMLALTLASGFVHAQSYPARAVRLVVGFPPGGANDTLARLLGERLQQRLAQPFLVENRPGANAIIATEAVAKSAPDGHTLLVGASGAMTFNPGLYPKLPYDPIRDFAPITMIGSFPLVLAVHPSVPATSVRELVALAKAQPGKLNYAAGSTPFQLAAELLKLQASVDIGHIPYKGSAAAVAAVMSGEVTMLFVDSPPIVQQIRAGKLRGLAVTAAARQPTLPDLPTMAEAGLADFVVTLWTSLFAPAGTPAAIVARLRDEVAASLREPEVRDRMLALGIEPVGNTPEELARVLKDDLDRWTRVIRAANVKAE
jgi:tripartite-type tricarboxylate transporter receptor subunit TctC